MTVTDQELESWLNEQLANVLGFPSVEEITQYILSIENVRDQEQYLREMLDPDEPSNMKLINDLKARVGSSVQSGRIIGDGSIRVYKKSDEVEEYIGGAKPKGKKKKASPGPEVVSTISAPSTQVSDSANKKKTKYVSMYSQDGQAKDVILLTGRHYCECQAAKHNLINNCTSCGRIVCQQEGSGPCLFCGSLVCTPKEQEILNRGSRKSEQLLKKIGGDQNPAFVPIQKQLLPNREKELQTGRERAEKHKQMLLEYDKTSERRTKVIDDESDYFSVDSDKWLTPEQRTALKKRDEELREKKYGSRLERKITFDFAGRQIIDEEDTSLKAYDPSKDNVVKQIMAAKPNDSFIESERKFIQDPESLVNPTIKCSRPIFQDNEAAPSNPQPSTALHGLSRVQDRELQEMSDAGVCLSMHQPWASLLVAGIKIHEGRTWYSPHRGRLWIHAASKVPNDQEIKELQNMYRVLTRKDNIMFPSNYPVSCLLGCVDVVDVMAQEQYREEFPNGESGSPYVFVCTNPQELLIKYPMSGKHKIYKLDPKIHQAAKKAVKKPPAQTVWT